MLITTKQAPELLMDVLKAGLVPMLTSSPGIGKSSIAKAIAKKHDLKVIDVRLSQCDPSDLLGFPSINETRTKSGYVPMDTFPIKGDPIPDGYDGWLLLLDEFNSAPLSVQAAAYKVVLDQEIGTFELHEKVAIIAAGNLATDKAITNRLSTAMQSRLTHLEMEILPKDWLEWAAKNDVDYRVKSYIAYQPESLHKFDPNHNDVTFSCPRTWEFVSKIIKPWTEIHQSKLAILAGTIGEGAAREFSAFTQIYGKLPSFMSIENSPLTATVPSEPSTLYAITGLLSHSIKVKNVDNVLEYIDRLPKEFQVITMQNVIRGNKNLLNVKSVQKWVGRNSQELM